MMTRHQAWFVAVLVLICAAALSAGAADDAQKLADRIDELIGAKHRDPNQRRCLSARSKAEYHP